MLVIGDGNYFVLQQDFDLTATEGDWCNAVSDETIDDDAVVVLHSDETEDEEEHDDDEDDVL